MKYPFCSIGAFGFRFVLVALLLFSIRATPGHAQSLSTKVHWTKDSTVTPSLEQCSDSGVIGGNAAIHITFTPDPNGGGSPRIREVRVHEIAGHTDDLVITDPNPSFQSMPDLVCGDDPNAGASYDNEFWPSPAGHNGPHTITVTADYMTYNYPYGYTVTTLTAPPITVDAQNLLITDTFPVHPKPILWDSAQTTVLHILATVTAAYKANQPVKLTLYDCKQNPVGVLKTEQDISIGIGPTSVSIPWDGTNSAMQPPNTMVSKGLYLFRFDIGRGLSFGDIDTEISPFVQIQPLKVNDISTYDPIFMGQDTDPDTQTARLIFQVRYHLVVSDKKGVVVKASEGHIEFYDSDFNLIQTSPLQDTVDHQDLSSGDHAVTVKIPKSAVSKLGNYTFLIHICDNHGDPDKGHRKRWALSNCNLFAYQIANLTDPVDDTAIQVFRGLPNLPPPQNFLMPYYTAPCPVVIKGNVAASVVLDAMGNPTISPVLSYTYSRESLDAQGNWHNVDPEADIPAAQQTNIITQKNAADGTINFRMTWNQRLLRTLTTPQQAYRVRAYVISRASQTGKDRRFQVMSLAYPVDSGISRRPKMTSVFGRRNTHGNTEPVFGRGLTPGQEFGPRPGFGETYGVSSNFLATWTLPTPKPKDPNIMFWHMGVDMASAAGNTVNTCEYGTIVQGTWTPYKGGNLNGPTIDAIPRAIMDAVVAAKTKYLNRIPAPPNPNLVLQIYSTATTKPINNFNLGPNLDMDHGIVNISLQNADPITYERDHVKTVYGHADETSFNPNLIGSTIEISQPLEKSGPWRYPQAGDFDNEANLQNYLSILLGRGYFVIQNAGLQLVDLNNNSYVVGHWDPVDIAFPSLNGPHLHLEVRLKEREGMDRGPNPGMYFGEVDPKDWLAILFGKTR